MLLIIVFALITAVKFAAHEQFALHLQVQPDKTFPLLTSSVNAGDLSNYSFLFKIPETIKAPCYLEIAFPKESFVAGMGMKFIPEATISNPNIVSQAQAPQIAENILKIFPSELNPNSDIEVVIKNIQNPYKIGGIGLFKLYTKCENQIVHVNENFANIGITEPKTSLLAASVEIDNGCSNLAGEQSRYIFRAWPALDVSPYAIFELEFPLIYNLTEIQEQVEDFPSSRPCTVQKGSGKPFSANTQFACHIGAAANILIITGLADSKLTRDREKYRINIQHQ